MQDLKASANQSPEAAGVAAPASRPSVTVAICTRNRVALLEKAVHSVLAQANTNVEILIVDNGSTDGTAELVGKFAAADPRVKLFREPQPGISIGRNLALRGAKGDWVIFLDDDATAEAGWLAAYEKFFLHLPNPRVAVIGGAVIPQYETPLPKWMDAEGKWGPQNQKPFCFAHGHTPSEGNSAYRRDVTLQAGGFDLRLGPRGDAAGYREGADLNLRLQGAGYEIWWLPDAPIRHLVHAGRLNLRWFLRAAFNGGRSIAIQRVKGRAPGVRKLYIAGRILVAPFHCAINLFVSLTTFPFRNGRVAAKALFRAASVAGFACELLKQL
ncbi:MAG: glycosyltransferase [Verrucomicrobiota bacterium]|jgi:glycosyltransferase involved in cell wall biosynthesis